MAAEYGEGVYPVAITLLVTQQEYTDIVDCAKERCTTTLELFRDAVLNDLHR